MRKPKVNDIRMKYLMIACQVVWGVDITKKSRKTHVVKSRDCFHYLLKKNTPYTLADIGSYTNADHATVYVSLGRADGYIKSDRIFSEFTEKTEKIYLTLQAEQEFEKLNLDELSSHAKSIFLSYDSKLRLVEQQRDELLIKLAKIKAEKLGALPSLFQDVLNLPEDRKQEFIKYKIEPFLKMEKSRKTYEAKA